MYWASSFFLSLFFCWVLSKIASPLRLIDKPNPERKFHLKPTPMIGGLAIWLTITSLLWLEGWSFLLPWWISISALTLSGLLDDLFELSAIWKLGVQILAASTFIFFHPYHSLWIKILCIFFIVLVINSVNYMDNSNGVCSGTALIMLAGMALCGYFPLKIHQSGIVFGAILGFLVINFPYGKVFLGDSGSHLLGGMIACSILESNIQSHTDFSISLVIIALPLFDLLQVTFGRIIRGQPFWKSDTYHLTHLLRRRGLRPPFDTLIQWMITLVFSISAFAIKSLNY
jgi:UDP-GlcNAc:undecaprenyl-phosphate GlcNAc-1-phosphate transferase